jgi:hypothetical protein
VDNTPLSGSKILIFPPLYCIHWLEPLRISVIGARLLVQGYSMNSGKCPKCEAPVTHVPVEPVDIREGGFRSKWHGLSFLCPTCYSVLGAGIDPVAIEAEMLHGIDRLLHRAKPVSTQR